MANLAFYRFCRIQAFEYSNLHWGGDKVRSSNVSGGAVIGLKTETGLFDPVCTESDMTVDSEVIPRPMSGPDVTEVTGCSSSDCFLSCVGAGNCLVKELISWLSWIISDKLDYLSLLASWFGFDLKQWKIFCDQFYYRFLEYHDF